MIDSIKSFWEKATPGDLIRIYEEHIYANFDTIKDEAVKKFEQGRKEHGDDFTMINYTEEKNKEIEDFNNYHIMEIETFYRD